MANRILSQNDSNSEKPLLCLEFAANKQKFPTIQQFAEPKSVQDIIDGTVYAIVVSIFQEVTISHDNYSSVFSILDSIGYKPQQPCTIEGLSAGNIDDHLNLCLIIEFAISDKTLTIDQLISDIRRLPRSFYVLDKQINFLEDAINLWISKFPCMHTLPDVKNAQTDIVKGLHIAGILSRIFSAQIPKNSIIINENLTEEQMKSNWDLCKPVLDDLGVFVPPKFPAPDKIFLCFVADLFYATRAGAKRFVKVEPPPPPVVVVKPIDTYVPPKPVIIKPVVNKQQRPKTTNAVRLSDKNRKLSNLKIDPSATKNAMSTPSVGSSNNDIEIDLVLAALQNVKGLTIEKQEMENFAKKIVRFSNGHHINYKNFMHQFGEKAADAQKFFEYCKSKPEGIPSNILKVVKKRPWIQKEHDSIDKTKSNENQAKSPVKSDKDSQIQSDQKDKTESKPKEPENDKKHKSKTKTDQDASKTSQNDNKAEDNQKSKDKYSENSKSDENEKDIKKSDENTSKTQTPIDRSKLPHVKWVGVDEIAARRAMINLQMREQQKSGDALLDYMANEYELLMDPPKKAVPEKFKISTPKKEINEHTSTVPNISTISNALKYHALPGPAHENEYNSLMKILQDRYSKERILILMASRTMKFKGVYILSDNRAVKIYGIGPECIYDTDVTSFFKFINGTKQYERILSKSYTQTTDGMSMKREKEPQSW